MAMQGDWGPSLRGRLPPSQLASPQPADRFLSLLLPFSCPLAVDKTREAEEALKPPEPPRPPPRPASTSSGPPASFGLSLGGVPSDFAPEDVERMMQDLLPHVRVRRGEDGGEEGEREGMRQGRGREEGGRRARRSKGRVCGWRVEGRWRGRRDR